MWGLFDLCDVRNLGCFDLYSSNRLGKSHPKMVVVARACACESDGCASDGRESDCHESDGGESDGGESDGRESDDCESESEGLGSDDCFHYLFDQCSALKKEAEFQGNLGNAHCRHACGACDAFGGLISWNGPPLVDHLGACPFANLHWAKLHSTPQMEARLVQNHLAYCLVQDHQCPFHQLLSILERRCLQTLEIHKPQRCLAVKPKVKD